RCRRGAFGDGFAGSRSAIITLLLRTLPSRALALAHLLDKIGRRALRAGMRHDPVPTGKLALRVTRAAEKEFAATAAPLQDLTLFALRAVDTGAYRISAQPLDSVTFRIA